MKKILIASLALCLMFSCQKDKKTSDGNAAFEKYKNNFIEEFWKENPGWASANGYHKYDSLLVVYNAEARNESVAFAKANLDSLKQFDIAALDANNSTDYRMIENQLKATLFGIEKEKSFEWDPSAYNVCGAFAEILNGNHDTPEIRLKNLSVKMNNVPAFYAAAKQNLKNPTVEHTQLAIAQNRGGLSVFETDLIKAVEESKLSKEEKDAIKAKAAKSVEAVKDYVSWLEKTENKSPRSFRLGKDLYAEKFKLQIESAHTADQMYEKAMNHKRELHEKMFVLADKLWPKYLGTAQKPDDKLLLIRQVIDKISLQHTTPENFQNAIEKQIPVLTQYIKDKDLIYIDPSKPLVVRREPDYMAGVAGASISAPGPYDKNGKTYYNVGSLSGWGKEESESFLREYNDYILQILNIHEAIPGHYTQLVYSNQSPSLIKAIFGNGAMIEGWAVYTELMMLESGYANSDEMWLMYYKWNLRSTCNTILDIAVHTKDMTKEQALDLLMKEAFQQQAEADGKWRRVNLTQVQLCSYFTGFSEIVDLRNELKQKMGKEFDLKKFHEKFLSYGSAPVKYIRELMLSELK